ncbi:MAG: AAA family ATPase, partial [Candidatus Eremiobacteraeota bacterium]|nr:AAA family ATPase [Candidatus Eremiobacteraeota bacterium]
ERALLARSAAGFDARDLATAGLEPVATAADVVAAQAEVRKLYVAESLQGYIYAIVARTRSATDLSLGASPRAALALLGAAQVAAAIEGRDYATPDDVKSVAALVLAHRLIVRPEAEIEGVTAERVVERILGAVDVPSDAPAAASLPASA